MIHDHQTIYSYFMTLVRRVPDDKVPTLGVLVDEVGTYTLLYNPEFVNKTAQYLDVWIKHEMDHLMFGHCTSRKARSKETHALWNVAFDLAVNQFHEDELPSDAELQVMLDRVGDPSIGLVVPGRGKFIRYPSGLCSEEYYDMLLEDPNMEEYKALGEGLGHEIWEQLDQLPEAARERIAKELADLANKFSGFMPEGMYEMVSREVPAQRIGIQDMKRLAESINGYYERSSIPKKTRSRLDRRYHAYPGTTYEMTDNNVVVLVDQSGSVNEEKLGKFLEFLRYINKHHGVIMVPFATEAALGFAKEYPVRRFRKVERCINGGTDVQASLEQAMKAYPKEKVFIIVSDFDTGVLKSESFSNEVYAVFLPEDENCVNSRTEIPHKSKYIIK